jgi:hypothetical protein
MPRLTDHLRLHRNQYEVRVTIPARARAAFGGKTCLRHPLGTTDLRTASRLKGAVVTDFKTRIAEALTRLYERRGTDHHYVIPETAILTRHRFGRAPSSQSTLLEIIPRAVLGATPGTLPFTPNEVTELLTTLYTLNDVWHWDALLDRCPDDERRTFG